jgi:5-hydroxyisourate hydrolase
MSAITTHVLDTALGRPAAGVRVVLERQDPDASWHLIGRGETDADGRLRTLMPDAGSAPPGTYRLTFDVGSYFDGQGVASFYPNVIVSFDVPDGEAHHHVPLLVSPFGYTTYRGS